MAERGKGMKKNVEVWADYVQNGRWCLRVQKSKGKFTLDELTKIAAEWGEDMYAVVDMGGGYATFYRATDFLTYQKEKPPTA